MNWPLLSLWREHKICSVKNDEVYNIFILYHGGEIDKELHKIIKFIS